MLFRDPASKDMRESHWGRLQHQTLAREHTKTAYSFLSSLLSNVEAIFIVRFVTHEYFQVFSQGSSYYAVITCHPNKAAMLLGGKRHGGETAP